MEISRSNFFKAMVFFFLLIMFINVSNHFTVFEVPLRMLYITTKGSRAQGQGAPQGAPSTTEAEAAQTHGHQTTREEMLRRCLNGMVAGAPGGRIGNMFMEMASAWAVARKHKLSLATPSAVRRVIEGAFSRAPLGRRLEDILSACHAPGGGAWNFTEEEVLRRWIKPGAVEAAAIALEKDLSLMKQRPDAPPPGPIVIERSIVLENYIMPLADELRAQVEWREELRAHAQTTLRAVAADAARSLGEPPETVVFVGVHVRRTDYMRHLKYVYHQPHTADVRYYKRAVARLHGDLQREAASGGRRADPLALVLVSDDMRWVRRELLPALNATARDLGRTAVIAAGDGGTTTALQDLALLAACNHTVMGYGTYAMTAGLLSGGRVIAFHVNDEYFTTQFAKLSPLWITIR